MPAERVKRADAPCPHKRFLIFRTAPHEFRDLPRRRLHQDRLRRQQLAKLQPRGPGAHAIQTVHHDLPIGRRQAARLARQTDQQPRPGALQRRRAAHDRLCNLASEIFRKRHSR